MYTNTKIHKMGKNLTIYFDDEALSYIEAIDGKGTLLNQLVKEHFGNDIENLKRKASSLNLEIEQINNKIQKIRENADLNNRIKREKEQQTEAQIQKKEFIIFFNTLKNTEQITIDEWAECFDKNGIIIDKAKGLLHGKNIRF